MSNSFGTSLLGMVCAQSHKMLTKGTESSRVLVVEDEKAARQALVMLLEYEGYEVRSASGGDEAMTLVNDWTPDVVVSDVNMRNGDGFTLVPALRRRSDCRDVAILLVSARDDIDRRVNGLNLGADDFLCKPVDPEELLARIRAYLRASSRRRTLQQTCLTDVCTELLNRRGLREALELEFQRAERGSVFSIVIMDLDNFKTINDEYGHATGDIVLQEVARNIAAAGRSADRYGRWGGDEFIALLNDCIAEDLEEAMARFRSRIEKTVVRALDREIPIHCSLGGATYREGVSTDGLLRESDESMCRDKRARREQRTLTSEEFAGDNG